MVLAVAAQIVELPALVQPVGILIDELCFEDCIMASIRVESEEMTFSSSLDKINYLCSRVSDSSAAWQLSRSTSLTEGAEMLSLNG